MFIIEKPYISEFLVDTIINHDWIVLENETIEDCGIEEGAFQLWSTEKATENYLKQEFPLIYSNSENAISWVYDNLPKSNLTSYIKFFKDKISFRESLKDLYPNFHFQSLEYLDINYVKKEDFTYPLVVKPSVGFLGFGVHIIKSMDEWDEEIRNLHKEIATTKSLYSKNVIDSTMILIEDLLEGEHYSIDAYYDRNGIPVILNIFKDLRANDKEVKGRLYYTNTSVIVKNMAKFAQLLRDIGERAKIRNFPMQLEVKITPDGDIFPMEAKPLQFACWCSSDIAKYAWGFNVYEYFNAQIQPDWNEILTSTSKDTYYFSILRIPDDYPKSSIRSFDYDACAANFPNVIELRRINYKDNSLFGVIFGKTEDENNLQNILNLDIKKYIK